ncbi:hypothetical protein GCM10011332_19920 [Terasakiella brassicae]|uniref:Protein cII n=1 Tax=Terasakiella brassicae TaxID=1634917 RepID=A0A917C1R8_9PROT|nr:sce7726 family protein [Terasakiella brassicae]GGF65846.1 hypothetical protein GCM10011332_19920 [Terasakiella brassicae]
MPKPLTKAREPEIKAEVLNHLLSEGAVDSESTIFNEFTIDRYSRRVDLAVLSDGQLIAFEIKSSGDTLTRLDGQVDKYLKFFDKVIIVSASKHLRKITEIAPQGVGIWEFSSDKIRVLKKGRSNKVIDKEHLLKLMKVNELRAASKKFRIATEAKDRNQIEYELKKISPERLRETAFRALAKRFQQSSQLFWERIGQNEVRPKDLSLLSKYSYHRANSDKKMKTWTEWLSSIEEDPYLLQASKLHADNIFGEVPPEIKKKLES